MGLRDRALIPLTAYTFARVSAATAMKVELGCGAIWQQLEVVQRQRNAFMHGNPEAITDGLVADTVRLVPEFHEAWIKSFNLRCAGQARSTAW
jgi:hypothetical protein